MILYGWGLGYKGLAATSLCVVGIMGGNLMYGRMDGVMINLLAKAK